jgi:hypothetical protein
VGPVEEAPAVSTLFPELAHRHLTDAGTWLLAEMRKHWTTYTALHRDTGLFRSSLMPYFCRTGFRPRVEFLRRLADALTRARAARGEPPVTREELVARRFGRGETYQQWRQEHGTLTPVPCDCGCRETVLTYDRRQDHHFINREHFRRWWRARREAREAGHAAQRAAHAAQRAAHRLRVRGRWTYPDDAAPKMREISEALNRAIDARGIEEVQRITGLTRITLWRVQHGIIERGRTLQHLDPRTADRLRRIIPAILDPADPSVQALLDTTEVHQEKGRRVGALNRTDRDESPFATVHSRRRKAAIAKQHRPVRFGEANPAASQFQRANWDSSKPDFTAKVAAFRENVCRPRLTPSEQIARAWARTERTCRLQGREPDDADAERCARNQAAHVRVWPKAVRLVINRLRGQPGRPFDIDLLCEMRDVRHETPAATVLQIAEKATFRLERPTDPGALDAIARWWRDNKHYLDRRPTAEPTNGGRHWTADEDRYVLENLHRTDEEIGRCLGRTLRSVLHHRRIILGLRKVGIAHTDAPVSEPAP